MVADDPLRQVSARLLYYFDTPLRMPADRPAQLVGLMSSFIRLPV